MLTFLKKSAARRNLFIVLCAVVMLSLATAGAAQAQAPYPAFYGGLLKDTAGNDVAWDAVYGYMNGELRGELYKEDLRPEDYNAGEYGMPYNDLVWVKHLVVHCLESEGLAGCNNKPVTFKVEVDGVVYDAVSNPSPVLWKSHDVRQVDLTIAMSNPTGLEGTVLLDGKADHQGTVVKVTQGSTVKTVTTSSNGSYQVTGLVPGSCTVEYDNENARWKKVTKNATIISDQMIQMPLVTLYIGDMNSDNMINLQDLLWMSRHIGKNSTSADWSTARYADVNGDNAVNILDLIKVNQNIGL
jgi:hypothetical protein